MTMWTQFSVNTYSFEFLFVVVRPDSKEFEKRLEVVQLVHHGRSGQTPTEGSVKGATGFAALCRGIFDVLRLVHNNSVEFARGREEDCLVTVQVGDLRASARFLHFFSFS